MERKEKRPKWSGSLVLLGTGQAGWRGCNEEVLLVSEEAGKMEEALSSQDHQGPISRDISYFRVEWHSCCREFLHGIGYQLMGPL